MPESDNVCLLIRRAGRTSVFPLPKRAVRFGYAPGGAGDLVLYDCLLKDVQGTIEYRSTPAPETGDQATGQQNLTSYWLGAAASGVELDGTRIPPRAGVALRLKFGHEIQVGENYHLIVAPYQPDQQAPVRAPVPAPAVVSRTSQAVPAELEQYFESSKLFLPYLPEIYRAHEDVSYQQHSFVARFLALFETVFLPMKWTVENFEVFLHPDSAPPEMLGWLASWYGIPFDQEILPESVQRAILRRMPALLERKGTPAGLIELLSLYTGSAVAIDEAMNSGEQKNADEVKTGEEEVKSRMFNVTLTPKPEPSERHAAQLEWLIGWYKPAETHFTLQ